MSGPARPRPVALDIALSLNTIADKFLEVLHGQRKLTRELRELAKAQEETLKAQRWLTERFSKLILEHGIHAELERFEKEQAQSKRFYKGYPGVPKRVLS